MRHISTVAEYYKWQEKGRFEKEYATAQAMANHATPCVHLQTVTVVI
jgi:hypothetical protein